MNTKFVKSSHYLRRSGFILIFLAIVISCKKSNNTTSASSLKYCGQIDWSNTVGESGTFNSGVVNGVYNLVYFEFTSSGSTGSYSLHYDANNHVINDQQDITFTYTGNDLTQIAVITDKGNGSYNFDSSGHLIKGVMNITSGSLTALMTGTYTYDSNDDPVKFSATGTVNTDQGPMNLDMEVTGDFLLNKTSMLPFSPVFAPATSYFSIIPFLSKHLLNKWTVSYTGTVGGATVVSANFVTQYTYTYDASGNVATMVNTGNSNNIYTFKYSACNLKTAI